MLVDTHCHLDFPEFDRDREGVIRRARDVGVQFIVNPGTDVESSRKAVRLAENHKEVFAAVGIHPHEAVKATISDLRQIESLSFGNRVVAIGETGLDFHYADSSREKQKEVFMAHLDIAFRRNLPVIVHQRDATQDIMDIFEKVKFQGRVVLHCFGGDGQFLQWCSEKNFFVSFTGIITFSNARKTAQAATMAPVDNVFLETDAPYLAPVPMRGKRNEPCFLPYIVEKFALLRGIETIKAQQITSKNALEFFSISTDEGAKTNDCDTS
jgi:TatD DNase family protein